MRTIPQAFRQEYNKGNRNYDVTINMTLTDSTELTITNENIWDGGFSFEQATSSESSFDIGSAVIGKCTIILDNIKEYYSSYDFFNATCWVYIGLVGLDEEPIRLGYYTVDETSYNGSLITLTCLDNMWTFDTPFKDIGFTFTSNTTARDVINAMCQYSGIGIQLATQSFHHYDLVVGEPKGELNCREVLQYLAQATCNYCKINSEGNLELLWYDKSVLNGITDYDGGTFLTKTTPYSDGDDLDGGDFITYGGDEADGGEFYNPNDTLVYITENMSMEVGTDDIVITGVRICTADPSREGGYDVEYHDRQCTIKCAGRGRQSVSGKH